MSRARFSGCLLCAAIWMVAGFGLRAAAAWADDSAPPAGVSSGAAIGPEFAEALYKQLAPLQESDGCRLARFDTQRFRIVVGLTSAAGGASTFEIASAPDPRGAERRVGSWSLAVPAATEQACPATVAAIQRVLEHAAKPAGSGRRVERVAPGASGPFANQAIVALSFLFVLLGTARILYRELRAQRPPPAPAVALLFIWVAALLLRLTLSPHAFMHEYYHIADTVPGYLTGENPVLYGETGPVLFRLMGALLQRPEDVAIIFLTTAIVSSLAIPAVALLDLAVMHSWPRALCAAVLLAVLPQHLRFSAGEDLFVHAITFGFWALTLVALYLRTRRTGDALIAAAATSLAMQARPEMVLFPVVIVAFALLVDRRSWRIVFAWPTLLALAVLCVLLVPRVVEVLHAVQRDPAPAVILPGVRHYLESLVVLQSHVTPPLVWLLGLAGFVYDGRRRPAYHVWILLSFVAFTLFSLSIGDNPPYFLRSQTLPNSFLVLIAAGAASLWMAVWPTRRVIGQRLGVCVLALVAAVIVIQTRGWVAELRDQQLEWQFLERNVARLPNEATLITAVNMGGRNLDAFPEFLLRGAGKNYRLVDVRSAASGDEAWPEAAGDLLFYQGMFCFFAFHDEPVPDPMTPPCLAVHERYASEPLLVTDVHTQGYSALRYTPPPYRIGFYRLKAR